MVRLKGCTQVQRQYRGHKFQFQYGAIKSPLVLFALRLKNLFQFQYGAIKSVQGINGAEKIDVFQFQYGAIKRF